MAGYRTAISSWWLDITGNQERSNSTFTFTLGHAHTRFSYVSIHLEFFSPCRYWISNVVVSWGKSNLLEINAVTLFHFSTCFATDENCSFQSNGSSPTMTESWQKKKSIMNSKNKIEATTNLMLTCFNCSSNVSKVRGPCDTNDSRCVLKGKKEQSIPLV